MTTIVTTFKVDTKTIPNPVSMAELHPGHRCPIGGGVVSTQGIRVNDDHASFLHAFVDIDSSGQLGITDNNSTNGTLLLGVNSDTWLRIPSNEFVPLAVGDRFLIGRTELEVRTETPKQIKELLTNAHQGRSLPSPMRNSDTIVYPKN